MTAPGMVRWDHILSVFEGTGNNMSASARILNMHRRTQRMPARGGPGSHWKLARREVFWLSDLNARKRGFSQR